MSVSALKAGGIVKDPALNLWLILGNTAILTVLSVLIHEHGGSVYSGGLKFFSTFYAVRSFTFVKFILKNFILLDAVLYEIVFIFNLFAATV